MSAAAVAASVPIQHPAGLSGRIGSQRKPRSATSVVVTSLLSFKQRTNDLFNEFEKNFINDPNKTDIIRRRMAMSQRLSSLLGEYSRDTRTMLLDGRSLDFDLPLYVYDSMCSLMQRSAKESSEKLSSKLKEAAGNIDKAIHTSSSSSDKDKINMVMDVLQQIQSVHQELKRLIAEFGSFFQPLATIPAGFFNLPPINIQEKYLSNVAQFWGSTADGIKKCLFTATDAERSVFHQQDAGTNPEAVRVRKAIADSLTLWMRIQHKGEELLKTQFIPDYLTDCQKALARIGSKMSVKELLDVTVIRIDNEQDRFRQLFNQDPTPVRRVVQLGLVKSQVERISHDHEVGLNAAMAQLPYAELFHKLVMMLDFEQKCIDSIAEAITRNVASELGAYLAHSAAAATAAAENGNGQNANDDDENNAAPQPTDSIIDNVASVYEKYRSAVASCNTTEQNKLRFYVAIRLGVNSGMGHAGMETTLVHHFHKLLKDSGALSPAEIQFLAFDIRAAVATFGPLLRDVDVFVRVYQHRLGSRLMSRKAPNPKLESFTIEELTGSIGIAYTHAMRSMVNQFMLSQQQQKNARTKQGVTATTTSSLQPDSNASSYVPISKYAWPSFSMMSQSSVVLHPMVEQMTKKDLATFSSGHSDLNASVHPLLTSVELRTGNNAGIFGNAVQCSMLLFLSEFKQNHANAVGGSGMSAVELGEKMKMTDKEAYWIAETLVRSKVVAVDKKATTSTYSILPLESDKRIVLSSVWGSASKSAARGARAGMKNKKRNLIATSGNKTKQDTTSTTQQHQDVNKNTQNNVSESESDDEEYDEGGAGCVLQ